MNQSGMSRPNHPHHHPAMGSQRSLPSPAPSDETGPSRTISPSMVNGVLQPALPRTAPTPIATNSHTMGNQHTNPLQSRYPSLNSRMHNPASPTVGSPTIASPAGPRPAGPSTPSSVQTPQKFQIRVSRIASEALVAKIRQFRAELEQVHQCSPTESGRLTLLEDSVNKGDWFYQTLHQVFCLRSLDPSSLPRSIRGIDPTGILHLERMLCPNQGLAPAFVKFCAEFPEPLMDLYSDPDRKVREVYEVRLARVQTFIGTLASRWDSFVNRHITECSPPLVQEMVEELNLNTSPVLHRVLFTAIARMFWGVSDCPALAVLSSLHELDSTSHSGGHVRTETEKITAKNHFRRVYDDWKTRALADPRTKHAPYEAPPEVFHFFRFTVPAAALASPRVMQPQQPAPTQSSTSGLQQAPPSLRVLTGRHNHLANMSTPSSPSSPSIAALLSQVRTPVAQSRPQASTNPPIVPSIIPSMMQHVRQYTPLHTPQQRQAQAAQIRPQLRKLFPPEGAGPSSQPTQPDVVRSGLHQAHLRSPVLVPTRLGGDADTIQDKSLPGPLRLYLHVVGYGLPPTGLASRPMQTLSFRVSPKAIARLPKRDPSTPTSISITTDTSLYRLRCCSYPEGGFASENAWITADTVWPPEITSIEFNGEMLETRKKLHHGKYLPVNVTDLLREGTNVLTIGMDTNSKRPATAKRYTIALEVLGAQTHQSILENLLRPTLPESRDAILSRATPSKGDKDEDVEMTDDLTITSTSQTISLLDPYTASRPVALPVRGKACLHRDPFDLDTFLGQLAPAQNLRLHGPAPPPGFVEGSSVTHPDAWRCPRCRGDVRPQTLVVDAFLLDVLARLKTEGKLGGDGGGVRAIVVNPDGSWAVKDELAGGGGGDRVGANAGGGGGFGVNPKKKVIEVIELD